MYIFNTTFHVEDTIKEAFLQFLKCEYIPAAIENDCLRNPRLTRVFAAQTEDGESYALQFEVDSPDMLDKWNCSVGKLLNERLINRFNKQIAGFVTVMQKIDIEL